MPSGAFFVQKVLEPADFLPFHVHLEAPCERYAEQNAGRFQDPGSCPAPRGDAESGARQDAAQFPAQHRELRILRADQHPLRGTPPAPVRASNQGIRPPRPTLVERFGEPFGRMGEALASLGGSDSLVQGPLRMPQGLLLPGRDELGESSLAQQAHVSIVVPAALDALRLGAKPGMG